MGCICCYKLCQPSAYNIASKDKALKRRLTGVIAVGSEGLGTHHGVPGTSIGPLATCVADPCDAGNGVAD
jgi:hypothetical protein